MAGGAKRAFQVTGRPSSPAGGRAAPSAASGPRALTPTSATSAAASDRHVMPPPAPTYAPPGCTTIERITIARSSAPSSPTQPKQPANTPRGSALESCRIVIAESFGAPVMLPAGNVASSRSPTRRPRGEPARDRAHELVDGRVRLDLEQAVDAHRAGLAHPREVVAHEIDDHDVLGALLLARAQLRGERGVRRRGRRRADACP